MYNKMYWSSTPIDDLRLILLIQKKIISFELFMKDDMINARHLILGLDPQFAQVEELFDSAGFLW